MEAASASRESRCAAVIAAAALIGPTVPGGIVDHHPDEAATAAIRVAELLLPWIEDGTALAEPERVRRKRESRAAATARPDVPGTGVDDGHEGAGTEAERPEAGPPEG
jgi:hypothetical protein